MYLEGSRSVFPKNIDNIVELFTLPSSKKQDVAKYQELLVKNDLSLEEQEVKNRLEKSLKQYIFDVEDWNLFGDILINMQKFFKEGVEPYFDEKAKYVEDFTNEKTRDVKNFVDKETKKVAVFTDNKTKEVEDLTNEKTNEIKSYTDNKTKEVEDFTIEKVSVFDNHINNFTSKGLWKPNTAYQRHNLVISEGNTYIALLDNTNYIPKDSPEQWELVTLKGEKGEPSLNINYKGTYNPNVEYQLGDAVVYGGLWYYAKTKTKDNVPTNPDFWELQYNQVLVDNKKPFDNRVDFWIDTSNGRVVKNFNEITKKWEAINSGGVWSNEDGKLYTAKDISEKSSKSDTDSFTEYTTFSGDIDSLNKVGRYYISSNAKNTPYEAGWFADVYKSKLSVNNLEHCFQVLYKMVGDKEVYIRNQWGGKWTEWQRVDGLNKADVEYVNKKDLELQRDVENKYEELNDRVSQHTVDINSKASQEDVENIIKDKQDRIFKDEINNSKYQIVFKNGQMYKREVK